MCKKLNPPLNKELGFGNWTSTGSSVPNCTKLHTFMKKGTYPEVWHTEFTFCTYVQ